MSKVKKAKNFGQNDWDTNTVAVQFANGVNGVIAYNPACTQNQFSNDVITVGETGIGTTCLAILYDVDGFKNPNTKDKDLKNLNVTSLGSNCAIELSDGTCFTAPFYPTAMSLSDCEAQKGELGISECYWSSDYWVGAVKACHDMGSSLPSQEQLDQLAKDLYPGTTIYTDYKYSNGQRDNDLAVSMGFISSPGNSFWLWSSEEDSEGYADYRDFGSTHTDRSYTYVKRLSSSGIQAVCLAE